MITLNRPMRSWNVHEGAGPVIRPAVDRRLGSTAGQMRSVAGGGPAPASPAWTPILESG